MGSGASASPPPFESVEAALAAGKTQIEIDEWKAANVPDGGDDANFWESMMAHRGNRDEQVEKFGPAPDYSDPGKGWYWYGQDGSSGPELVPKESDVSKPAISERPADVFYIHPTSYNGALWNMPFDDPEYRHSTDFYVSTEASVFNGSCRIFAPKFRQSVIAGMLYPDDGKLATELAYSDIKTAFEHYLANEHKGRPLILASHSQGSLYTLRLMLDFIEQKELFRSFVACYGMASWAPLSLFEGDAAKFKQIKLCQSATATGCYISWNCEHPDTVSKHCANKASKEPGDWYPQMGHKVDKDEWRIAHGEPIVCTNPLNWTSNGLSSEATIPEEWLGMLNLLGGTGQDEVALTDMDSLIGLLYTPNGRLQVQEMSKITPDEFNAKMENGAKFEATLSPASGDLQLVAVPTEFGGSGTDSYEHLNFLIFWFNIRKNLAARVEKFCAQSESA